MVSVLFLGDPAGCLFSFPDRLRRRSKEPSFRYKSGKDRLLLSLVRTAHFNFNSHTT
ncbi:hypothetical protein SAMN05444955_11373 [Lihuaxuella thermophila]|uniref:Uncharacterized protein n=1 Tax=Lihuaxuella thermophila TaxID=1173111 RepID=A0A1H8H7V1_9BACL|nr:hypothetical protein SAMN05444955_11373 [Lihuaxuella thermophila]